VNMFEAEPFWAWTFAILAVLALVLFLFATWSGRWGMWLAGYVFAVLALAAAVTAGHRGATPEPEPASSMSRLLTLPLAASAQPSPATGVWHPTDPRASSVALESKKAI